MLSSDDAIPLPTMIQGVNETYELTGVKPEEVPKDANDSMNSRLVLIGKNRIFIEKTIFINRNHL